MVNSTERHQKTAHILVAMTVTQLTQQNIIRTAWVLAAMTATQLTQQNIFKTIRVLAAMTATIWLTQQHIIRKLHVFWQP
jgi:hypothetical protein